MAHEESAIAAWRQLVAAAGDVYAGDLMMGARSAALCGHWKDELAGLEKGFAALKRKRRELPAAGSVQQKTAPRHIAPTTTGASEPPVVVHTPITTAAAGKPLKIAAEVRSPGGVKWVRVRYRSVTQFDDFQTLPMLPTGEKDQYQVVIPAEQIVAQWDFMYLIEVMDKQGHGRIYPDLNRQTPYIVVRLVR